METTRTPEHHSRITRLLLPVFAAGFLSTGCQVPSVRIATPEPIVVDINMRVDVYQHEETDRPADATAEAGQRPEPTESTPESRRRNRMADIQEFKNSRLVGEGRDGLLAIIDAPPGEYGQYVTRAVADENADRMEVMQEVAEKSKRPLPAVQADQAAEWRKRAFRGEWIEVLGEDGETYVWKQKEG